MFLSSSDWGWELAAMPAECAASTRAAVRRGRMIRTRSGGGVWLEEPALYTATIACQGRGGATLHAFYALIARSDEEAASRLERRLGPVARHAELRRGFDPASQMAIGMLSEAVSDMLLLVEAAPDSPLAQGLDLLVEQRFVS